jgi:hypothetical protein
MRIALFSGNYNYLREGANQALNILVKYLEEKAGCTVRIYSPVTETPAFAPAGTLGRKLINRLEDWRFA